ncbi:hypothetical protein PISMIDRAFT_116353 [Pisolithus microcarpus 441]|uniref:Uncharacterized protein n=1 Tax=Pisolithus microcarpus 441 TaxID=765257 RepID=A0A0C9YLQ6_9AGAM|nr:hypothetical protein PISMIDRAFT_116353 [Pisolithus microcarpus 441]
MVCLYFIAVSPKQHLSDVVKQNALEYQQLSQADKLLLIKEFKEFRNDKTTGMCITARSKVNDITHTLGTIKDEVCSHSSHISSMDLIDFTDIASPPQITYRC